MTAYSIISHPLFEALSLTVIIINSVTLAIDSGDTDQKKTSEMSAIEYFLYVIELSFLYIYTVEMFLKILGLGFIFGENSYLKNSWNKLDFIIVTSAWFNYW